jgi:hypothetical protein
MNNNFTESFWAIFGATAGFVSGIGIGGLILVFLAKLFDLLKG